MYIGLIQNAGLLLSLSILYSLLTRTPGIGKRWGKVLSGILFGGMAVIGMTLPIHYSAGIIYDGRSIILGMAGLFGGGIASAISILIAGVYRIQIGGAGVWAGLATIIGCAMTGLAFRRFYGNRPEEIGTLPLYWVGISIHVVMLASQLLIQPWGIGVTVIQKILVPVMLIFPAATMLMGFLLRSENNRIRTEHNLLESEALFRGIYENVSIGMYRTTPDGRILTANPALIRMLGYSSFDELSQLNLESNPSQIPETPRSRFKEILEQHDRLDGLESAWRRKDGTLLWIRENARTVRDGNGNILYYEGTVEDVTQRKLAEDKLRESEGKYRLVFNNVPLGIFHYDTEGVILSCNDKFVEIIGSSKEQLVGLNMLNLPDQEIVEAVRESIGGNAWFYEGDYHSFTAEKVTPVRVFFTPLISEEGEIKGGAGIAEDITKRKQADAERESLQEQLLQSQKIESVGRLAGGVAHDYNNMLGVILGRAEMVLSKMDPDDPNHASMEAIMRAGKRSADLTRQLLAFARKQTIQPKVMNLNDTIESMLKMLRQIIGEHIDLSWQPARDLWTVEMDPVQVDQILANLCVNARDALPDMGKITIETENKIIDESYCTTHPESKPGRYVMLTVSDDGCGMDEETRSHIFDPFFTTKGVGEGTGLGLSTVYGIVKQNNGFINVYSELDKGTTFRIYIPQNGDTVSEETETKVTELPRGNGQRILLVEDEVVLLEMAKTMLEELGYQVKTASLPVEALSSLQGNTSGIDLLITDVVMPGMSGKELAGEVRKRCENVKVLFMSGYTANAIAHHGVLDKGVAFIQKPFSLCELAHKTEEALERPDTEQ